MCVVTGECAYLSRLGDGGEATGKLKLSAKSVRNKEREPVAISDQQKASTMLIHIGFSSLQNTGLA